MIGSRWRARDAVRVSQIVAEKECARGELFIILTGIIVKYSGIPGGPELKIVFWKIQTLGF
jgi:hypothetical protein